MFMAYEINEHKFPIYGVSIIGKQWHFIIFENNEYCVSKSFTTDDEEIFVIFKILKKLKIILLENVKKL